MARRSERLAHVSLPTSTAADAETYDFEFVPDKSADERLEIYDPIFNKIMNVAHIQAWKHPCAQAVKYSSPIARFLAR